MVREVGHRCRLKEKYKLTLTLGFRGTVFYYRIHVCRRRGYLSHCSVLVVYLGVVGRELQGCSLSRVLLSAVPPSAVVANDRHRPASHVFVSKLLKRKGVEGG